MLSDISITSSNLCVINKIAIPESASFLIILSRFEASLSVSTAVGSSNTKNLIPVLSISLAISINCIYPTGNPATLIHSSIFMSTLSKAFLASLPIFAYSTVFNLGPNSLLTKLSFVISLFNLMFSVML